ncbi:MAG: PEP-CTERM sorting domain-containing protein [Akkermansiaceae bacterium]|jgi:hypothetical protein|nr:PEP-CTERM sorting domain-containing protein [Akkermansiaceae bacterium]
MKINQKIKTILPLAAFAGLAVSANAAVMSIDFESNDIVQSGDPTHNLGPSLPGQVGDWYKMHNNTGSNFTASPSVVTPGGTFNFNTGGNLFRFEGKPRDTSILRENYAFLGSGDDTAYSYDGAHSWSLTNLTPNGVYNIIMYSMHDNNFGGNYLGPSMFSVDGFDAGNGVGVAIGGEGASLTAAELDAIGDESDTTFFGVVADGTGTITGTWDHLDTDGGEARWGGIQFEQIPEPSTTALLGLGGLALILRRRK